MTIRNSFFVCCLSDSDLKRLTVLQRIDLWEDANCKKGYRVATPTLKRSLSTQANDISIQRPHVFCRTLNTKPIPDRPTAELCTTEQHIFAVVSHLSCLCVLTFSSFSLHRYVNDQWTFCQPCANAKSPLDR